MTLVAVGSQAAGRYCLDSLSPVFLHVWVYASHTSKAVGIETNTSRSW